MSLPRGHALYAGRVWHRRRTPTHRIDQRVTMAWLDLDELADLEGISPLLSASHPAPARFRRSDHLGDPSLPLADAARDAVASELGIRPEGPVFLLANLRTFGWCFNPISLYFLCDGDGELVAELLDVANTPWHEHHHYVLDRRGGASSFTFPKAFHVSPFLPMSLRYAVTSPEPGSHLRFGLTVSEQSGAEVFDAGLAATRAPLDAAGLRRLLVRTPTQRVSLGIYAHAARLWRRGAMVHPHPERRPTQ